MLQNSTASRVMYGFLLLVTVVISCIMLAPGVQVSLTFLLYFFILRNYCGDEDFHDSYAENLSPPKARGP